MWNKDKQNLLGILEAIEKIDGVKIKGFRNIVAHIYFRIDAEEIWQIVNTHLSTFKTDLKRILEEMD